MAKKKAKKRIKKLRKQLRRLQSRLESISESSQIDISPLASLAGELAASLASTSLPAKQAKALSSQLSSLSGDLDRLAADLTGPGLPSARATDEAGWAGLLSGGGPVDRPWSELSREFSDVLEAWRVNAWVRQFVRLQTAYVVGDGIKVSSKIKAVQDFLDLFWNHEENHMRDRLAPWCDETTRAGEIFPVLFTNRISGMSQVRIVPASCIPHIVTDDDDYEKELEYHEKQPGKLEPKKWKSKRTANVRPPAIDGRRYKVEPVMLHYVVNRVVGATRGESDLTPLLPWARRYTDWLKERLLFSRVRNQLAVIWLKLRDDKQVPAKKNQIESNPPSEGGIYVSGPDEELQILSAKIEGGEAAPDGKALRLAMATATNLSLVHFGEGDTANLSTTVSMDDRTFRTVRQRQEDFGGFLVDLCNHAYRRFATITSAEIPDDLGIQAEFPDISRADNKELAEAARALIQGLAELRRVFGFDREFDKVALPLAFKFAGELLEEDEIKRILNAPQQNGSPPLDEEPADDEQMHLLEKFYGPRDPNGNGSTALRHPA